PRLLAGDFVMVATPTERIRSKLQARWTGPYRVERFLSDHICEVRNLLDNQITTIHIARAMFYDDHSLNITTELKQQMASDSWIYEVEKILDIREKDTTYEVLIKWKGFETLENSWESIDQIEQDVPKILRTYINNMPDSPLKKNLKRFLSERR